MADPTPYDVMQGEVMVKGQITLGFTVGVRLWATPTTMIDAIVFAPTKHEALTVAQHLRPKGDAVLFGANRNSRCILAGEEQVTIPGLEVREVGQFEWDEATRPTPL